MQFRDYTYLGTTQSFCPECLESARVKTGCLGELSVERDREARSALVPAKIIDRGGRVYFRKQCPVHGTREDFVCSDAGGSTATSSPRPAKCLRGWRSSRPAAARSIAACAPSTSSTRAWACWRLRRRAISNARCATRPAGRAACICRYDECCRAIDHLVVAEGRPEVLQLSGGEPTIHPEFLEIFKYACGQPIDIVMINTNGVRLARDQAFLEAVAEFRHRAEIYLQFDSFDDAAYRQLRGESLVETKLHAIEALGAARMRTILVCTLQAGVNEHEIGAIVRFAQERPWITGVSFQPASYVGRTVLPEELERRVTFPDVIRGIAQQCPEVWRESDFSPLPCAHPNAHSLAYAYRAAGSVVPLARFIDVSPHLDLLSGSITFTRSRARELVTKLMERQCCSAGGCCGSTQESPDLVELSVSNGRPIGNRSDHLRISELEHVAEEFFRRVLAEDVSPADVFRITTTSFMDAYNFDVRQAMKDCVHFVLPTGHIIPFSAYNLLYRDGLVPLPPLRKKFTTESTEDTEEDVVSIQSTVRT